MREEILQIIIIFLIFVIGITSYFLIGKLKLRNCPFECCVDMKGWKEKTCPVGFECRGNECVKFTEYNISFENFERERILLVQPTSPIFIKNCRNNPNYSIVAITPRYVYDYLDHSWKYVSPYPTFNSSKIKIEEPSLIMPKLEGEVKLPSYEGKPGLFCAIFPSKLLREINRTYCLHPLFETYATSFPQNVSCDFMTPFFFCGGYYYFDEVVPVMLGGGQYCGFYDSASWHSDVKVLEEESEKCPEQLKSYLEGEISYIGLNAPGKEPVVCTPKVKLKGRINVLVIFAYSDQPLDEEIIRLLESNSKDESLNYIAEWYKSQSKIYSNTSVNINFTFLPRQYQVRINTTRILNEYEIRDEIVDEEKFLYENLILPLKQQGVNFEDYNATLILYNNPELPPKRIWVSGGHADRYRGFAYVNLAVWLSDGKLDMGDAESIVRTAAHELGHVFGAYDIGKIEGKNCLMGSGSTALSENELCAYKDVGWYDVDGDGMIEVDDPCPYDKLNLCEATVMETNR